MLGLAVLGPQSKPLFKRIITEQALEPILSGEILQNTAQRALNKTYQNALEKLINLILSGIAIESYN